MGLLKASLWAQLKGQNLDPSMVNLLDEKREIKMDKEWA